MIKFNREVWGLINTRTGELFAPLKLYNTWFRGVYDSEKAAKAGARLLNKEVAELDDGTLDSKELNEYYGFDVEAVKGVYVPVKLKGAELDE